MMLLHRISEAFQELSKFGIILIFALVVTHIEPARSLVFLHRLRSAAPPGTDPAKADSDALTAWAQLLLATNRFLYID